MTPKLLLASFSHHFRENSRTSLMLHLLIFRLINTIMILHDNNASTIKMHLISDH